MLGESCGGDGSKVDGTGIRVDRICRQFGRLFFVVVLIEGESEGV